MMRKKISWLFLLTVFLSFSLHSCRTEDFMEQETQKQTANYKVYMIDKKQLTADFELFSRVAQIQEVFSERKTNAKTTQEGLLDGAVIGISKVLVVEDENRQKTYTFPLKRIYPSNKIENLVLKRNPDSTFSGMLVQYDLTAQQKDLFNRWHTLDLKSKTAIYDISNLHINTQARVVNYQIGCITISYEDGKCGGDLHHEYGDTTCPYIGTSLQATAPRILSITAVPGCGGGGDSGMGSYPVGTGSNTSAGGGDANTMMFDEYDLTYYNSDDMTDPDFIFWSKVNQFIQAQPQIVKNFNNEYHYVFYFVHTFFKANGMSDANKLFVSQRLQQIAQWYYDPTTGTHLDYNQKLAVAILAVKYMLENPTVTWEQYKNQFLTSPCEKTKSILNNPQRQAKIQELRDKSKASGEKAFMTKADGTQSQIIEGTDHSAQLGDITGYQGYSHNHTPKGIKMFSCEDIHKLFEFIFKQPPGTPVDAPFGEMIGSQVCPNCTGGYEYYDYIIRFNGLPYEATNIYQTVYDFKKLADSYTKFEMKIKNKAEYASQNGNFISSKGLETVFLKALELMGIDKNKMILQKVDQNGKVSNVTLDANGKPQDIPCPN